MRRNVVANGKNAMRAAVCVLICIFAAAFARAEESVGFRKIKTATGAFGVWYPAAAAPNMTRLGFFAVEYAENAAPSGDNLPLVVLSHGNGGRFRNHHRTASYLAENGFVVAAPQHKDPRDAAPDIPARVADIKGAIRALRKNKDFAPVLSAENIAAVGYSLGGATALAAAGVGVDWESFKLHCARNYDKDETACAGFPFWFRWFLRAKHALLPNPKIAFWDFSENPVPFRKIALVAPVGKPMDAKTLAKLSAKVLILQMDEDEVLRAPFHSEHLRDHLPPQNTKYELIRGAHHYGFVGPFPRRAINADPELAKLFPPDFDGAKFISEINEKILAFLRE